MKFAAPYACTYTDTFDESSLETHAAGKYLSTGCPVDGPFHRAQNTR